MGRVPPRPFNDPRNTQVVDNNDPHAHNKLYVGIPGTHLEQRCCDNKPPARLPEATGWYVDAAENRVCNIIEYWRRPENRPAARDGWWNAPTPPGLYVEMAPTGALTCSGCRGSRWDEFVEALEYTLNEMLPVIEGAAIAASYFPVLGTAVSFVLNSAVSLAQGGDLDEAVLGAIGDALPGQPASGAAYRVARTILRDGEIDDALVAAIPVTDEVRAAIGSSVNIALAIANGRQIDEAALAELYRTLPETGRRGVDVARRIIAGEQVTEIIVSDVTLAAAELARQQGTAAVNSFIAQSGFQSAIETIDPALQAAVRTGIGVGYAQGSKPFVGTFDHREKHTQRNETLAAKGRAIIAAGATWRGRRLADIRDGSTYTFTRKALDPLTHSEQMRTDIYRIDGGWRRGFDVAIGLCEGLEENSEEQMLVVASLNRMSAQHGFEVGQYIQHRRTTGEWRDLLLGEYNSGQDFLRINAGLAEALLEPFDNLQGDGLGRDGVVATVGGYRIPDLIAEVRTSRFTGRLDSDKLPIDVQELKVHEDKPVPVVSLLRLRMLAIKKISESPRLTFRQYSDWATSQFEGSGMAVTPSQFDFLRSGISIEYDRDYGSAHQTSLRTYGAWVINQEPLVGKVARTGRVKVYGKFRPTGGFPSDFEKLLPEG
jgi:hypothetical protein